MRLIQRCDSCRRFIKPSQKCTCGNHARRRDYWVEYREGGKLKREKVGPKDIAEVRLGDIQRAILEKRYLSINKNTTKTIGQIISWYADLKEVQGLKSYKERIRCLRKLSSDLGAETLVSTLSPSGLLRWRSDRLTTVEPATVNRELSYLKACLNTAVSYEELETNPVAGLKLLKEDNHRHVGLTEEKLRGLIKTMKNDIKCITLVAYYCMMRRGEILKLKRKDVDLDNWMITIPPEIEKTGKMRKVKIPDQVRFLFNVQKSAFPLHSMFNSDSKSESYFSKGFAKATKKAGLTDFHFHDLRHASAQWYYDNGNDVATIMQVGGWSSFSMLSKYLFNNKKDLDVKFG